MSKNKHLTLDDRATIQTELDKGTSFKEIGLILGKDCTTISGGDADKKLDSYRTPKGAKPKCIHKIK